MKVLMVSWEYPPVVIGGLGRHVHHLATALAEAGHEVVVLSRRPFGTDPSSHPSTDELSEGVRVVAAAQDPHEFDFGDRHDGVDAGHGSRDGSGRSGAEDPGDARASRGVPTSCTRTTGWSPIPPSHWPNTSTSHWFPRFTPPRRAGTPGGCPAASAGRCTPSSRGWCANPTRSSRVRRRWATSSPNCSARASRRLRVIRNGIDAGLWPFAKRKPRSGPARLLYLGRLEYEKGIHDAIAAMPRIRRTHPGTTLTIAGDGTQQDFLIEQARKHKVLKAIDFVGRVDHEQLVALLHDTDAAVLPSHYEPFGIVALEAAATGAPLVTSNVGGLGEAVHQRRDRRLVPAARRRGAGRRGAGASSTIPPPRNAERSAARARLTSDFDWAHRRRRDRAGLPRRQTW